MPDVSTQSRPDYMGVMAVEARNRSGRVWGWDSSGWLRPLGEVHAAEEGLEAGGRARGIVTPPSRPLDGPLQSHLLASRPDPPVCDDVHRNHDAPKNDLSRASQASWVQEWQ
jgi:hypothetical protein